VEGTHNYVTVDGTIHHNSGKSVACVIEILLRSLAQEPNRQGIRTTRWVVIRSSFRMLKDTTIKTYNDWIPPSMGRWRWGDMTHIIDIPHPSGDGSRVNAEVLFRSLEKPSDVSKLLSLELTGAFINEAKDTPKAIFDMLLGRVGRYPSNRDVGPTWFGIILDSNPCDTDHWIYKTFEEHRPDNYSRYKQPSGRSPEAENIENLPKGYYRNLVPGKSKDWVSVYVDGNYGLATDGKPVWPEYSDDVHYLDIDYQVSTTETIFVGIDFGLEPAATFMQQGPSGKWFLFDELVATEMGAERFSQLLHEVISQRYRGIPIQVFGDPAGDQRAQTDETTPFMILRANGINAFPTHTNSWTVRREAVASILTKLDFAGQPAFAVTKGAPIARKSLAGGYCYKRVAVVGQERFQDKPDKGPLSHVGDSIQYCAIGAGLGSKLIESDWGNQQLDYSNIDRMVV